MGSGYLWVVAALEERDLGMYAPNGSYRCPAHDDTRASLSVSDDGEGNALVYCHAGCATEDVMKALGLEMYHLFSDEDVAEPELTGAGNGEGAARQVLARYIYTDEQGEPLIRVTRFEPKGFIQERWSAHGWATPLGDVRRTLYRLPDVSAAVSAGQTVYIVEGEKDADALATLGVHSTTSIGGAGKWRDEYTKALVGARCVVIPDLDEPGEKHAATVAAQLRLVAENVSVKRPAAGKDVSDHLAAGYGIRELVGFSADWDDWTEEVPSTDWLVPGIIASGTLVWAYGPKESAKSMYLLDLCTRLSHEGRKVTYYSEEMALTVHNRYVSRFRPRRGFFRTKWGRGLNLTDPAAVERVIEENEGSVLIVFDSYEKVWQTSGRDENRRAVDFATMASDIIRATGATVIVIDHTGFGYRDSEGTMHDQRQPRGASTKEQQADMSILFSTRGKYDGGASFKFCMENMKPGRLGNPFKLEMELCDTPDGGLTVVRLGEPIDARPSDSIMRHGDVRGEPGLGVGEHSPLLEAVANPPQDVAGASSNAASGEYDEDEPDVDVARESPQAERAPAAIVEEGVGRAGLAHERPLVAADHPSSMTIEEQLAYARVMKLFGLNKEKEERS